LSRIEALKSGKKDFDRSVELGFDFCFQQNAYGGGSMAEGHRQRATRIAVIARDRRNGKKQKASPLLARMTLIRNRLIW
jgi:hypothetical protein